MDSDRMCGTLTECGMHAENRPSMASPTEGRCKATWNREFKLPRCGAGPPNHHDDEVDSDQ